MTKGGAENENGVWFMPTDNKTGVNPVEFSLDGDATSYTYYLQRYTTKGEQTVKIINSSDPIFTVPESVKFADGKNIAELTITFGDVPAKNTKVSFEIAKESVAIYGAGYFKFDGYLNKTWENLGIGQMFDNLTLMSSTSYGIQNVTILKSKVEEKYRILEPYANAEEDLIAAWGEDCLGGPACSMIEITEYPYKTEKGDTIKCFSWDKYWFNTLLYSGGNSYIMAMMPSYYSDSNANLDVLSCWAEEGKIIELRPYWYVNGVGSFGADYPVFIALPGVDLEAWLDE